MHAELVARRQALLVTYQRYTEADRAWNLARREMATWFPATGHSALSPIGNPGSVMRRLFDQRDRALLQLGTARLKLETARQRLAMRRGKTQAPRFLRATLDVPQKP